MGPYVSQPFTLPADSRTAERRSERPAEAEGGLEVGRGAGAGGVEGEVQERVGGELVIYVQSDADLIAGRCDARSREGERVGAVRTSEGRGISIEAVDHLGAQEHLGGWIDLPTRGQAEAPSLVVWLIAL